MRYPVRSTGSIDDVFRPDTVPMRQGHLPSSIVWSEVPSYPEEGDAVFDIGHLRTLLGYPLRAARRRRRAALGVFLVVIALTVLAVLILPRSYLIESRILAQRNVVMPMLGNPKRAIPVESDAPTRLAAEAVLSRDNLLGIVRATDLLRAWPSIVSPAGRVRARIAEALSGAPSDSERVEALVGLLRQRLWVVSSEKEGTDGTVTIGISWPDRQTGVRIAQVAQQNFLEQRHASQLSLIGESIGILESHVASARQAIEESLADLRRAPRVRDATVLRSESSPPPIRRSIAEANEIAALQGSLAAKRTLITDLVSARNQRLASLQTQLAELQGKYGPAHPEVASIQQSIRALGPDSPQLETLRAEERSARSRLAALHAPEMTSAEPAQAQAALARGALERFAISRLDSLEDPTVTYARSKLKIATSNYEDLLDRLEGARIEMETARAAFKYRYSVIMPPQLPKRPDKPNLVLLLVGGVVLAVVLALFTASALDMTSGKVLEPWQLDRQLGLPLLGVVRRL